MTAAVMLGALLALPAAATAQQPTKPEPRCGLTVTDPTGDNASQVPTQVRPRPAALDITKVFFDHDPSGDGRTTVNIQVVDLSTTLPVGATGFNWTAQWRAPDGVTRFVRAVLDYTGAVIYEYGELIPGVDTPVLTNVLPRYEPRGTTTGALFTGAQGVVQVAIPASWGGAAGTQLDEIYAQASEARQVIPNAVNSPTRGLSFAADRAPDAATTAKWKVADSACPPPAEAA